MRQRISLLHPSGESEIDRVPTSGGRYNCWHPIALLFQQPADTMSRFVLLLLLGLLSPLSSTASRELAASTSIAEPRSLTEIPDNAADIVKQLGKAINFITDDLFDQTLGHQR